MKIDGGNINLDQKLVQLNAKEKAADGSEMSVRTVSTSASVYDNESFEYERC